MDRTSEGSDQLRKKALRLLHTYVKEPRVLCHVFATEQVMKALSRRLGKDEQTWAVAALVHDLDIELQGFDFSCHGHKTKEILVEEGFDPDFIEDVVIHNECAWDWKERTTDFQWALAAGDRMTWLIYASMRAQPDKSLAGLTSDIVVRRYHDREFARSVDRPTIMECRRLGFSLEEFTDICLNALKQGLPQCC